MEEDKILQNIFGKDLIIEDNYGQRILHINTFYGRVMISCTDGFPTITLPDLNRSDEQAAINYMRNNSNKVPMVYELVFQFVNWITKDEEHEIIEVNLDVENKLTDDMFYKWKRNRNKISKALEEGISGKEFFLKIRNRSDYQEMINEE
ncbi:hypothetical protein TCON_2424 [Astathelohania contejeani]|uniref:Uncharacterized protein n=1 Tax=Astathelohania contejeani TaxID=164912 RepID=A0ABQ7HW29_9MICR|nr:hypothetical protein TCON_2424 [Thelohania contejeani]